MLAAMQAGAVGVLRKDTLTTDSLATAVRAAANGDRRRHARSCSRELLDGIGRRRTASPPARASPTASSRCCR